MTIKVGAGDIAPEPIVKLHFLCKTCGHREVVIAVRKEYYTLGCMCPKCNANTWTLDRILP